MTQLEAEAIRAKCKLRVTSLVCEHLHQELELHERVYLTGNYYCTDCGEVVSKEAVTS
jgi:hypothetical protein